jgi:hypothetical protein
VRLLRKLRAWWRGNLDPVTEEKIGAPFETVEVQGKSRNGLYLSRIALYDDRIALELFASRPFRAADLADMRLEDGVDTQYEMIPPKTDVIDGKARIEFEPSVPTDWSNLYLNQPGRVLMIMRTLD